MRKKLVILLFFVNLSFLYYLGAEAFEQKVEDLSASVEVAPVFSLSLDNPNLVFGLVHSGETKVLGEGSLFNEIRCRSNSGRPWYIRTKLVSLNHLKNQYSLPLSNLKFKIVDSVGSAVPLGRFGFQEFLAESLPIYDSQGDDNRGREVILKFQYSLSIPLDAPAGNYIGQIIFTMSETP